MTYSLGAGPPDASGGGGSAHLRLPRVLCREGQPRRLLVLPRLLLVGAYDSHHCWVRKHVKKRLVFITEMPNLALTTSTPPPPPHMRLVASFLKLYRG